MSEGILIPLHEAQPIVEKYIGILAPHCERITVAGSILRKRPYVSDIEIVCIPKKEKQGLFGDVEVNCADFREAAAGCGVRVVGRSIGKYFKAKLKEGPMLDVFMPHADNWGYILAIRTGSVRFSKYLADCWVRAGFHGEDGMLTKNGASIPLREESELFQICGIPYREPDQREFV